MTATTKNNDIRQLDELTGGAFSASTSGERATRVRAWLALDPNAEQLQEVFRELGARDKGAARPVRERLDEIRRAKGQEVLAAEWATKARVLLAVAKLNIADALAWQRDAAKAGAPLSKEPLLSVKSQLADRVRVIEDLQHRVQVQREAAVLLAQRIDVLSTKPWLAAQAVWDALRGDVAHWQAQAAELLADANWASVDLKFPPLLDASRGQLLVVWEAFQSALAQAVAAAGDAAAPLPPVPVWADELRQARGVPIEAQPKPQKPRIDPEQRQQANARVSDVLAKLEQEITQGHGKASAGAASALRNALKEFGKIIDDGLENKVHAALAAAGEMEGWQRWRADQLRQELVTQAEGLLTRPPGQAIGGRKMQETLRGLREQWKQTDQGGVPNHGMWKRFDDACNEAHKVVESWLDKIKAESVENRGQRLALIEEVKAWAAANTSALDDDWRGFHRLLHQFGDRWREGGHVGEKMFAELQPLWQAAIETAAAPLEALQKLSLERRQAMIEEAKVLGAAPILRVDAVKALQQRWQGEAQTVPMDRRQEQKLWDAFRQPVDEAFERKTVERQKAESALGEHDRLVLDAAKALDNANASGDAQRIRAAMAALDAALRGQAQAQGVAQAAKEAEPQALVAPAPLAAADQSTLPQQSLDVPPADASTQTDSAPDSSTPEAMETTPTPKPAPKPKPVVAVRGDDRPGMKKSEPAAPGRGKFGDRKDGARAPFGASRGDTRPAGRGGERFDARDERGPRPDWTPTPRLGDAAFRAQRDALERAQLALRKLASQAHGESLTQLLDAWQKRDPALLPPAQDLGSRVVPAARAAWVQALGAAGGSAPDTALLRLEMAAELPTSAEYIDARRMFQLRLLTRRNDPTPTQTWAQDVGHVLATAFDEKNERRLRNVLKVLLKP
jgi:ATP-dependent RNA helicase SUPV3L1/SUV3